MTFAPCLKFTRLLALAVAWLAVTQPARTQADGACPCSLFGATVPVIADAGADSAVQLGVRVTPAYDGYITALRFYKSAANVGTHVGRLWSNEGVGLASVTFVDETASGWQEARFAVPVAVVAGKTYVASYQAPTGHYAFTADYFTAAHQQGPLTSPASGATPNGVFAYDDFAMPTASYRAANYWVDVTFETLAAAAPAVIGVVPVSGAQNAAAPVEATFNREMDQASIDFRLTRPDGTLVAGTVAYDRPTRVARLTPGQPLAGLTTYTASIQGRSSTGEAMAAPYAWSFTTGAVGFRDTVVMTGLQSPTTFRFAASGHVFVAEKSGLIKVFEDLNDSTPVIFADLRTEVHNFWDRGLLGLTLDPNFPQQPFVYVAYSRDAVIGGAAPLYGVAGATSDGCPTTQSPLGDGCIISARVSRLRAAAVAGGYQMTGVEEVLVDGWGQQYPSHSIGGLEFGADGGLYVTGGEGASYSFVDYGQRGAPPNPLGDPPTPIGEAATPPDAEGGALRSQSRRRAAGGPVLLNGMVLRIDPATGEGLPDNPLASSADANARRVIAEGLRNPYRFTIKPGTNDVWVGDVGWNDVEEINRVPGARTGVVNFGWPCYEGFAPQPGYQATGLALCTALYATAGAVERPVFQYTHYEKVVAGEACGTGSSAIAGLAFYQGGAYPSQFSGALFFADYARRCIWAALPDATGQIDFDRRVSILSDAGSPVELRVGPGGDLFYVDLSWGTIHRIQYLTSGELPPVVGASIAATPRTGPGPLTVEFDGGQSTGTNLTYRWEFGDGTAPVTAGPQVTRTYPIGDYVARLTVTDDTGTSASASTTISARSAAPTPVIDAPLATLRFGVGQSIAFSGRATDGEDGPLAASQLSWSLVMNHCSDETHCHAHAVQEFPGVAAGAFAAPDHEYPCYMVLTLTARNSRGVSASTSVRLDPRTVKLTFATAPAGLSLVLGSSNAVAPAIQTRIVGSSSSMAAPASQTLNGTEYRFVGWSDGGSATHDVVAPSQDTVYTASYAPQPPAGTATLFGGAVPATPDAGADGPVELGLKFRADVNGTVTGVRFYKSAANTGPHVGSLWTSAGARLGFVTFTAETASGWQEARFATPIDVTAGAVYVVSYHSTGGHYSHNANFFATEHHAGVLHAPAATNGVFKYGGAGSFPTASYGSANYWVDVLFTSTPDTTAPTISAHSPGTGATEISCSSRITVTFSEPLNASSIVAGTLTLTDAAGAPVAGSVGYDAAARVATFTPGAALAPQTIYTARVAGGSSPSAPRDAAGNPLASAMVWSFGTTAPAPPAGTAATLFPATMTPATIDAGADSAVELGVKFRAATGGAVAGVRFYKSAANTGPHVGSLWTAGGVRLAQVTFSSETASGWQEARFATPVTIAPNTTYLVSYHTTGGHYSLTPGFFHSAYDRAPLAAPATSVEPNGVFRYGATAGQFPSASYNAGNYWVDVLFQPAGPDVVPPTVTATAPAAGATGVPLTQAVTATFSEPMNAASIDSLSFTVRDAAGAAQSGATSYDAATRTVRFAAAPALQPGATYSARLVGGTASTAITDVAGNPMATDHSWTFTTVAADGGGCPCTLFGSSLVPAVIDAGADSSVELGVKFTAAESGYIRGVRFYKSAANAGPHEVSLWTATGTLLTRANSVSETASGWQEVTFGAPVAVTAGTVYVASYHVHGGHYSYTSGYFGTPRDAAPLHAPAGANGVFAYGPVSVFPGSSYNSANYWVDVVFTRQP